MAMFNIKSRYDMDNNIVPALRWGSSSSGYVSLQSKYNTNDPNAATYDYGVEMDPANYLFCMLVEYGLDHKNTNPSTYATSSTGSSFDTSRRVATKLDNNYMLIGPYKFTLSDTATLTSATISVSNYKMYKANKTTEVSGSTFADKLRNISGQDFYIRVPNSVDLTTLNIAINTTRNVSEINCLTVGANALANQQPLVEFKKGPKAENFADQFNWTPDSNFDLALRKYITKINNTDITNRVPSITAQEIANLYNQNGYFNSDKEPKTAKTTAKKTHIKTPLEVKTGDKVVYDIRIYNEGNIDGKCTQITDHLPAGLTLTPNSQINSTYGWTASADGRTVTTAYLANQTFWIQKLLKSNVQLQQITQIQE